MPQDVPDFTTAAVIRPQPLGFIQPGIGGTVTTTFPITVGTHAISLLTGTGTGLPTPQLAQSIKVHGNSSGVDYFVSPAPLTTFYQVVPVDSGRDISVDVTVQAQAAQDTRVYVSAIFDTQVVFLAGQKDLPLPAVDVSDRAARLLGITDVSDRAARLLGQADVTDRNARILGNLGTLPPLWQSPRDWRSVSTAVNGAVTLVAAVPGQNIWVFGWDLEMDGSTNGVLGHIQDVTVGRPIGSLSCNGAAVAIASHSGFAGGLPIGVGNGLNLNAVSVPAGGSLRGSVTFSQG